VQNGNSGLSQYGFTVMKPDTPLDGFFVLVFPVEENKDNLPKGFIFANHFDKWIGLPKMFPSVQSLSNVKWE
jgi:hypothetical protein